MSNYNYLESEEGIRRFNQPEAYELSLKFQNEMGELGIAWHNTFSDECVQDFSCCCGVNIDDDNKKYHTFMPSNRSVVKLALQELFEITKHGDKEHQDWLENEFKQYVKNNY